MKNLRNEKSALLR